MNDYGLAPVTVYTFSIVADVDSVNAVGKYNVNIKDIFSCRNYQVPVHLSMNISDWRQTLHAIAMLKYIISS